MSIVAALAVPHPPLIIPEVGRGEERKIQKTIDAYRRVMRRAAALRPDVVVLISPHSVMYGDYFHISPGNSATGNFSRFNAPSVSVRADYDVEFVKTLSQLCAREGLSAGTLGERGRELDHGALIPLRFLNEFFQDYRLVRVGLSCLGPLEHYRLGGFIARAGEELHRRVLLVASGDTSHKLKPEGPYGYSPDGPVFDRRLVDALDKADFMRLLEFSPELCDNAAECGLRSFQIMAGALDGRAVKGGLLSYEGPFGVGYCVAAYEPGEPDESRRFGAALAEKEHARLLERQAAEDEYVRLARLSLETFVATGRRAALPSGLSPELLENRAGAFVSLKKHGRLRGCIGTVSATTSSVAREIMQNAVSAAANDPRFSPVTRDELAELEYSVDVLGEAEPVSDESALDPARYGVIVERGSKRGLLLPDLEGVDTAARQISIARRKAGVGENEPVKLYRFEVRRHK